MENTATAQNLETHFKKFRENIVGIGHSFEGKNGNKPVVYADWIASGRLYQPIEKKICDEVGPFVSNPHSYSSHTGQNITRVYSESRHIVRQHVNASENDALVTVGAGMTGALMRLQEIIGVKNRDKKYSDPSEKPVVFVTHMEHHSNQVSWQETCAEVVILPPGKDNLVDPQKLEEALAKYKDRKTKIGAFTACSNVTGIITPYYEMAGIMHRHAGVCFVDFAASAPYVKMDMNPANPNQKLDAITFSPHKFLGGPGACGILLFDKKLHCGIPCVPGGGNVKWTNPWGEFGYTSDVEAMEDGGTPGFMQAIRAALAIRLKEQMDPEKMKKREGELLHRAFDAFAEMERLDIVGGTDRFISRIGALSFNVKGLHYNLVVRLLNDYFGIQARGGWSCASTYCHYLFDMDSENSRKLTEGISQSNLTGKPGWVRLSLHPTMTDKELDFCMEAVREIVEKGEEWGRDYHYEPTNNEYMPNENGRSPVAKTDRFFDFA